MAGGGALPSAAPTSQTNLTLSLRKKVHWLIKEGWLIGWWRRSEIELLGRQTHNQLLATIDEINEWRAGQPFNFTSIHQPTKEKINFSFLIDSFRSLEWNGLIKKDIITVIWRQYSCCMFMEWKNFEFLNGMINGIAMLTAARPTHFFHFHQSSLPNGKIDCEMKRNEGLRAPSGL